MAVSSRNSFDTRDTLKVGDRSYTFYSLEKLAKTRPAVSKLPFSLKILLESLLRNEDGRLVETAHIEALCNWDAKAKPEHEIPFMPARVLLQDFTGVPAVVDLAAMRDAVAAAGGDPTRINPLIPAELVIDHSVQVDVFGTPDAFRRNAELEFKRNVERYAFLRWGQDAFDNFRVVPPDTGIVHQVNVEYLARVVFDAEVNGERIAYPDTLVGTDSHTTMVNGLGVLGWGVGGIEAEAAMLGQPMSMLIPQVIGFRLRGKLSEGATATDLVLTCTEMLRKYGVVGKFVEFFGDGLVNLSLADRATLGNMAPEFGSTCGITPIDAETIQYLKFTGRDPERLALVEAYAKAQGLFHTADSPEPAYSDTLDLDLATVEASIAGPKRPHDRVPLVRSKSMFEDSLGELLKTAKADRSAEAQNVPLNGESVVLRHGTVVIAAITSCTNTSNPSVMIGAGLLAKKAVEKGLRAKPWVKTSLAPGSKVVTDYLNEAGLMASLEALNFHLVGYGCTTCIGNSGPLPLEVSKAVRENNLVAVAVLSGNRNFEGRINPDVRANYLASPALVVAYALTGRMDIDLYQEPLGQDSDGQDVYLKDIWPSPVEIQETIRRAVKTEQFTTQYADAFKGDEQWRALEVPAGDRFKWQDDSTYVRHPTFFENMSKDPPLLSDIQNARVLVMLGDSVTTDHISPAGPIAKDSAAARYLMEHGVDPQDFNSYGARRGNHEVMMRGTFANIRLRNQLAPGTEGGVTRHLPTGEQMSIYDASMKYQKDGVSLVVLAGKEYGSGSSRDWAAKGTSMLGIKAVIAESYERIHRSNLIGLGVLPLEFLSGDGRESLGLTGEEAFTISGIAEVAPRTRLRVTAEANGTKKEFEVLTRIDTPPEVDYYLHGGILQYVLRQLQKQGTVSE
jgi:aconitate hydratase